MNDWLVFILLLLLISLVSNLIQGFNNKTITSQVDRENELKKYYFKLWDKACREEEEAFYKNIKLMAGIQKLQKEIKKLKKNKS